MTEHAIKSFPVSITWSQFIREPYEIGEPLGGDRMGSRRANTLARPIGLGKEYGDYRIHAGRYDLDPEQHRRRVELRGQPVVATLDGQIVGACNGTFLWVHPSHRDTGLAIELLIELFLIVGVKRWCRPPAIKAGKRMRYSQEGLKALETMFRTMVGRGIVDPGGSVVADPFSGPGPTAETRWARFIEDMDVHVRDAESPGHNVICRKHITHYTPSRHRFSTERACVNCMAEIRRRAKSDK